MYIDYKGIQARVINSLENHLNRKYPTELGSPVVMHEARLVALSVQTACKSRVLMI